MLELRPVLLLRQGVQDCLVGGDVDEGVAQESARLNGWGGGIGQGRLRKGA